MSLPGRLWEIALLRLATPRPAERPDRVDGDEFVWQCSIVVLVVWPIDTRRSKPHVPVRRPRAQQRFRPDWFLAGNNPVFGYQKSKAYLKTKKSNSLIIHQDKDQKTSKVAQKLKLTSKISDPKN